MTGSSPALGRPPALRVDPAFIAGVVFLRRACSVSEIALILGCDRKRVLKVLARLTRLGGPTRRPRRAPRYRPLSGAQQEECAALHNNGHGLDFFAICRVMRDAHPLAVHLFLQNAVGPRGWSVRPCLGCGVLVATPTPALRLCTAGCGAERRAPASA